MNIDKYNAAFIETFGVDPSALDESFTFADTPGWDSLAHLELVAALEDAFGIMLDPEEIMHFGSYENGKRVLETYGIEF